MFRFFIDYTPEGEQITLTGEDAHHLLKVLRMKPGERLILCDGAGYDYDCVFAAAAGGAATCNIMGRTPSLGEPTTAVTLYMGLPKSGKMDFIVQKAVELGAVHIVPFLAEHSVSRPDARSISKKCERWRKIAREAAMQSGRGRIPTVGEPMTQSEAAAEAVKCEIALFLYEGERDTGIKQMIFGKRPASAALMIGPEGGFSPSEIKAAKAAGMQSVSLGKRILRCETAPMAALSILMYETGNM